MVRPIWTRDMVYTGRYLWYRVLSTWFFVSTLCVFFFFVNMVFCVFVVNMVFCVFVVNMVFCVFVVNMVFCVFVVNMFFFVFCVLSTWFFECCQHLDMDARYGLYRPVSSLIQSVVNMALWEGDAKIDGLVDDIYCKWVDMKPLLRLFFKKNVKITLIYGRPYRTAWLAWRFLNGARCPCR